MMQLRDIVQERKDQIEKYDPSPTEMEAGWEALSPHGVPSRDLVRDYVRAMAICPELKETALTEFELSREIEIGLGRMPG